MLLHAGHVLMWLVSLHVTQSRSQLKSCHAYGAAACRGFEEQLAAEGVDGEKQVQRVRSLFHRQLQVHDLNFLIMLTTVAKFFRVPCPTWYAACML